MSARPGPRNLITDVAGIKIGNATDDTLQSGVTVVLPDAPVVASVDVRGGAPGTRETDLLDPAARIDRIDAIVLSGGSAFGLDAAAGLMGWLAERGRGVSVGGAIVPIVPAAILFDLRDGIERRWGDMPPYRALARRAADAAADEFALGNAGAGLGAKAGAAQGRARQRLDHDAGWRDRGRAGRRQPLGLGRDAGLALLLGLGAGAGRRVRRPTAPRSRRHRPSPTCRTAPRCASAPTRPWPWSRPTRPCRRPIVVGSP